MSADPDQVAGLARQWLGTPYRHQAARLGAGCDCLGLLRGIWRELYGDEPLEMPPYRADMRDRAHAASLLETARRLLEPVDCAPDKGLVVLFRLGSASSPKHCGVLVSPDRFIHSAERIGVVEASLSNAWRTRIADLFRFP